MEGIGELEQEHVELCQRRRGVEGEGGTDFLEFLKDVVVENAEDLLILGFGVVGGVCGVVFDSNGEDCCVAELFFTLEDGGGGVNDGGSGDHSWSSGLGERSR